MMYYLNIKYSNNIKYVINGDNRYIIKYISKQV